MNRIFYKDQWMAYECHPEIENKLGEALSKAAALPVLNDEIVFEYIKRPAIEGHEYDFPGTMELQWQYKKHKDCEWEKCHVSVYQEHKTVGEPKEARKGYILSLPSSAPVDKIFIDGDFNDSYEARIQRSKKKKSKPTSTGDDDTYYLRGPSEFAAPVEKEEKMSLGELLLNAGQKISDLQEENARLRSLIEELIPMAEQYKKGIVGLSDRAAYRTGEVISRARSLLTAGDKSTDPDHNKPDL
jgi:hypothetical protein